MFPKQLKDKVLKSSSLLLCFLLIFEQSGLAQVAATLDISGHLTGLRNAFTPPDVFRPLHLRYLSYNPQANNFQLFLDKGSLKNPNPQELKDTTKTLLNYFLVGVTLPNDTFWVNLRPDAEDNIIDDRLAQTDVGRIMLESDLQLKKDTAKFTSPETAEGREYWNKLYKKAEEIFGSSNITIPTLTRPWIVPDEIIIRETKDSAYIYKATLKVMLEEDYLQGAGWMVQGAGYEFKDQRLKELNEYSSQLIREIIIPKLAKEVNSSKRYAPLRQVYYSLIMAQWFKARFDKSPVTSLQSPVLKRINSGDLTNLTSQEPWSKTTYFQAYQKSFKDGEYSIQGPVSTPYGQTIRSYFSGGISRIAPEIPAFGSSPVTDPKTGAKIISSPAISFPSVNNDVLVGITFSQADGKESVAISPAETKAAGASSPAEGKTEVSLNTSQPAIVSRQEVDKIISSGEGGFMYSSTGRRTVVLTQDIITVDMWEYGITKVNWTNPVLATTAAGPCFILTIYDPISKVGFLTHLPYIPSEDFIDWALSRMQQEGTNKYDFSNLQVKIIGGFDYPAEISKVFILLTLRDRGIRDIEWEKEVREFRSAALDTRTGEVFDVVSLRINTSAYTEYNRNRVDRSSGIIGEIIKTDGIIGEIIKIPPDELYQKLMDSLTSSKEITSPDASTSSLTTESIRHTSSPTHFQNQAINPGGIDGSASSPSIPRKEELGGIDFRSLPIVTQAIGNLSANISSSAINNLIRINLNEEWSRIERLASSGITPSAERIKEYIQSSCAQGNITQDRDKILLCIADILRLQEERCQSTNPTLRDILVVLESMQDREELKEVFLGAV